MIKKLYFLLAIFFFLSGTAQSQLLSYDVVKGSKKKGTVTVEQSLDGDQVKYNIYSKVSFSVLFSFTIEYWLEEKFYDGKLTWGKGHNTLNDRLQKESEIYIGDKGNYIVNIDGVASPTEHKEIFYSVSKLYSQEPIGMDKVYSQSFGRYLPLIDLGNHSYLLESPDGNNKYTYEFGICKEVKLVRDFATFYFRIQEESFVRAKKTK